MLSMQATRKKIDHQIVSVAIHSYVISVKQHQIYTLAAVETHCKVNVPPSRSITHPFVLSHLPSKVDIRKFSLGI